MTVKFLFLCLSLAICFQQQENHRASTRYGKHDPSGRCAPRPGRTGEGAYLCSYTEFFFSSAGAPSKGLRQGRVFLRMAGPRLLPREAEALEQPPERGRMERLAKAGFAEAHKVLGRKGREAACRARACEQDADQLGLQCRGAAQRKGRCRALSNSRSIQASTISRRPWRPTCRWNARFSPRHGPRAYRLEQLRLLPSRIQTKPLLRVKNGTSTPQGAQLGIFDCPVYR
jgi:hypothetical protein